MSLPARYDMKVVRGESWSEVFMVEDETIPPTPMDLTGRVVSAVIDSPPLTLTAGAGLDVTTTTGRVAVSLDATQTAGMAKTTWALWLDKGTPTADILVTGNVYAIGG